MLTDLSRARLTRRLWAQTALATAWAVAGPARSASADPAGADALALLRRGGAGLVVVMRHASAPGTFDPPGFRLGDCSTQRNLGDAGRAQARGIGAWYRERGLVPAAVRSSEWCRCRDTAALAFGTVQAWPALNSVIGEAAPRAAQTAALRAELARQAAANAAGFEVWVTHQVNISELAGTFADSGEAVLLRHDRASGAPVVLAGLRIG